MKLFVAGATGFVGKELVRQRAEAGDAVVAHVRPDSGSLERWRGLFSGQGAEVDTSAWEPDAMAQALASHAPDVVFCLIGTTKKRMRELGADAARASYEAIDYGLTKLLVDATATSAPGARFVYLSSMGVSASAPGAYMQARYEAEQAVLASGLAYVIARPGVITGERDESRPLERLGGIASDVLSGVAAVFGAKRAAARFAATDDAELAGAMARLAAAPEVDVVVEAEGLRAVD